MFFRINSQEQKQEQKSVRIRVRRPGSPIVLPFKFNPKSNQPIGIVKEIIPRLLSSRLAENKFILFNSLF